ncbi:acyl-CoA thioesterase [Thauera chlorobenzoica]|uniref:4-hydroxybenzoyl-CoA thioesterase family active site n=1 Tax=Thauera chlorobenzoica TaxID=96773 RepID=A0A1H5Y2G2_9RHOO|nr:thioesterase family protein [Thauera chlorobenzoica]APR03650.1 4-hydroxybenzoyl-CoA thioesterase family active site [Thauera chlorobenzoica]SEG18088.1 4-hydroxybenzoyl-CoA thioesterase [Thauera chlorobenzoica]
MLANTRTLQVEFGHCDPSGIVFNPHYFVWFDFSVHALLGRAGLTLKSMIDEFGIDGIPLVDNQARFKAPSRWGDDIVIESRIAAVHRSAFEIRHLVRNGDTIAVECSETRVWTAFDPEQGRIRAKPLPPRIVALLSGAAPGA